ncbi:MAG: hypothetical protein IKV80_08085 [Bacteroidales bacterium]|nr:hypothetical protein [Bacteroidales bacterium]
MFSDGKSYNRILLDKIESFIKKFYLNKLIQGALIGSVILILSFLIFNVIEYISWFPGKIRLMLFITLVSIFSIIIVSYFVIPCINLIRFRKKMSNKEAAVLIGKFFPEIKDKLLNTLQLTDEISGNQDNELLIATIEQRTQNLQTFNFSDAVNLKGNYKYLKIFGISFIVLIALILFFPDFSQKPVERIINYDKFYEKPLPFQVKLQAEEMEVTQGDDLEFRIYVSGEKIPEAFYVNTSVGTRMMSKTSTNEFYYIFNNIYQSETFQIKGGDYISPEIRIIVNPSPALLYYETELAFPKYINRKNETLSGKTRIMVPQGTEAKFIFHTKDVTEMNILHDSTNHVLKSEGNNYVYSFKTLQTSKFYVNISNKWSESNNPIPFTIEVIPDAYPEIQVQAFNENFSKQTYYSGLIADDYGFTKLLYHFEVENKPNQSFAKRIDINKKATRTSFYYSIDLDTLTIFPGDEIKSYFEIWDNDGINGAKSRRSELFHINIPTRETLDSIADASEENIISNLEEKTNNLEQLRKDIDEMIKDLMSKKELDWTDKEKIKELLEKEKEIQEEWKKIQEEQNELQDFMKENELTSEDLLKKQEEINKLFDEVIPEEMKKLMEEIEKMLSEMPREKMQQMMQDLKKSNKELQEMMDRNLALLEQLKVEKDLNDLINKINDLSDKLQNTDKNNNSLKAEDAKNQFDKLSKELDSIMEKNKGLQEPFNISKDEKMENEINQDLEEAGEMENNGNDSGSSQKKNAAGKKMKEMANKLSSDMMMAGMEQLGEDAHLVRILLENVVRSSHEEEKLMNEVGKMKKDDPSLSEKISRQKEITDNFVIVEDSLRKMAMRQPKIKNFIFTELQLINQQLNLSMKEMNEMILLTAASRQQRAMMSMNNLALMLSESLNDMNESMMEASGSCSKPKNSKKPSKSQQNMKNMKDLQEQLGKQLEQLRKEMQQQQQQKEGKPQQSMSEEFAKMAAEQEMLREGMQKMLEEMKKEGLTGDDGINEIIKDMEKLEEDLVNKKITNQTMRRNRDILSRMLKAQNAQEEREKEEKRKSDEFKGSYEKRNIDELEYQENLKKQQEFLKMNSIEYQPFYKSKINDYFFKKNIKTKE